MSVLMAHPLAATLAACLAGGALALLAAAGTLALKPARIQRLVSFAVGALLGAVFLELLPHALEDVPAEGVMITVLAGLLGFFLLEKLVLWRHSHDHGGTGTHAHPHASHGSAQERHRTDGGDGGRSGLMIVVGNSVHNFCDGIVIAAAFTANPALGIATTLAIVAHAIPQQVGDFAVLVTSGYQRRRAFGYNLATAAATVVGGLAGYFFLAEMEDLLPRVLAIAAASLLYVAVADLIPMLHRQPAPLETAKQLALILLGIGVIAGVHVALEG